jgi:hypothetical protein
MKTVVNKTRRPLRVPLPGGKVLHLGPSKTGQIADGAAEHAALRKMIEAGEIVIQGEGGAEAGTEGGAGAPGDAAAGGDSTHGRAKSTVIHRRGNRGA